MELCDEAGKPDAKLTAAIKAGALEKDLLLLTCGSDHNVVRFIAPLIVGKEEIDKAMDIIAGVFEEIL